jgi:hypothetical protein
MSVVRDHIKEGNLPPEFSNYEEEICNGAVRGLDISDFNSMKEWAEWLSFASAVLDETDYLRATIYAVSLAPKLAGTDYGTARQRDLGQLWTDAIRGFLGEIALAKWLNQRFGIKVSLCYRKGDLEEFLPSDIKEVNGRPPNLNVSIKTTKLGGIWLDVPYKQIEHSDVFVLVRVGVGREHFVAFLKSISVIRDKILKKGLDLGIVSENEYEDILNEIPDFEKIPAYIAGFLDKREFRDQLEKDLVLTADGVIKGRKSRKMVVNKFLGFWHPEEERYKKALLEKYMKAHPGASPDVVKIEFEGIGDFSKTLHFVASSGVLKRKKHEWSSLVEHL